MSNAELLRLILRLISQLPYFLDILAEIWHLIETAPKRTRKKLRAQVGDHLQVVLEKGDEDSCLTSLTTFCDVLKKSA